MVYNWRNLVFLAFLGLLFIYSRSEGGRLPTFLFVVFAVIFGAELMAFLIFRGTVKVELFLPEEVGEANRPYEIRVKLRFPKITPGTMQIKYALPYSWSAEERSEFALTLPWGETSAYTTLRLLPSQRGAYHLGPFFAAFEDPLRLFNGKLRIHPTQQVLVGPALIPLWQLDWLQDDIALGRRLEISGELSSSARAYQHGDPWKRIHWKASARRQQLMVRETDDEDSDSILLWLDLAYASYVDDIDKLEIAISLAYTLLTHFNNIGLPVRFVASGRQVREFSLPTTDFEQIRHYLALARADGQKKVAEHLAGIQACGTMWAISGKLTPQFIEQINYQARRYEKMQVILTNASHTGRLDNLNLNARVEIRSYDGAEGKKTISVV